MAVVVCLCLIWDKGIVYSKLSSFCGMYKALGINSVHKVVVVILCVCVVIDALALVLL